MSIHKNPEATMIIPERVVTMIDQKGFAILLLLL